MSYRKSITEKLKSIWHGWYNAYLYHTGKLPAGVKALMDDRLRVCKSNECGMLKAGICTACGCPVSKKTKSLTEFCPENMWNPSTYIILGAPPFILLGEIPQPILNSFVAYNKNGKLLSARELKLMSRVEEPWATKDSWDEFMEWWEKELSV